MPPDRVKPLLDWGMERLKQAGCDTPLFDARIMLRAASGLSREDMILDPQRMLPETAVGSFAALIGRREAREPVSRILGEREFYGRRFRVTPDVLDPRPDTETLVEAALKLDPPWRSVLDLGTGSGAIIITLLAERPEAVGMATDLSPAVLSVAEANAHRLGVAGRLTFRQGSWFGPVAGRFDLIVSNPPYIPEYEISGLEPDVRNFDPRLALVGGVDGLDCYRVIAARTLPHLADGGRVMVEIGAGQADDATAIFGARGFRLAARHSDLGGHARCLEFVTDGALRP